MLADRSNSSLHATIGVRRKRGNASAALALFGARDWRLSVIRLPVRRYTRIRAIPLLIRSTMFCHGASHRIGEARLNSGPGTAFEIDRFWRTVRLIPHQKQHRDWCSHLSGREPEARPTFRSCSGSSVNWRSMTPNRSESPGDVSRLHGLSGFDGLNACSSTARSPASPAACQSHRCPWRHCAASIDRNTR